MRRGLLVIDRGSREPEAAAELGEICAGVKERGGYDYAGFCFLEVLPPFIREGMDEALSHGLDALTIVPYFLYPGKKVKAAVTDAMRLQAGTDTKFVVTRPMSMHPAMVELVDRRVEAAMREGGATAPKRDVDVLVIGHGSKDPNAAMSIQYLVDGLAPAYRNVSHCFLEIEQPDIKQGIEKCRRDGPRTLVIVFYFLHEGAHVKRDIYADLNPALEEAGMKGALITKHIGADEMMVDLIMERAGEVEGADKQGPVD